MTVHGIDFLIDHKPHNIKLSGNDSCMTLFDGRKLIVVFETWYITISPVSKLRQIFQ